MNLRTTPLFAGLLAAALLPGAAHAAKSDTTTFQVKIVITESCDVHTATASDVDFGTHARASETAAIDSEGTLNLTCSKGTPYQIGMNPGLNSTSTTAGADNRRMTSTDGNFVPYGLYRDSGRTAFWGATGGNNMLIGTGTAASQSIPIYGRVLSTAAAPAGTYADTVTATVTY